jgi:hypothetical protein
MAFGPCAPSVRTSLVEASRIHLVWLVHQDERIVDGLWSYRCEALPEEGDVIVVEDMYWLTPDSRQAQVTQVRPASGFPISATQL